MVGRLDLLFQHLTNDILHGIAEKVKALPHRDITIGTYKDWVELYITSLRRFGTLLKEETRSEGLQEASSAFSTSHRSVPLTSVCETYLSYVRREIDAVLLSSIFATKWNDVHLPLPYASPKGCPPPLSSCGTNERSYQKASTTSSSASTTPFSPRSSSPLPSAWWYHSNVYSWKNRQHSIMEMISPEFLTEPLLGGRTLSLYWNGLKSHRRLQASSSLPTEGQQNDREGRTSVETSTVMPFPSLLVPFSTLWALKAEAFGHATPSRSAVATTPSLTTAGSPRHRATSLSPPLSFQERHVRQTLLHTLQFSLELITSSSPFVGWHTSFPRLLLLLPSEELDAICHLPALRHRFWPRTSMTDCSFTQPPSSSAPLSPPFSSSHSPRGISPSPWTMDAVSEDGTCRLAYFSQACAELVATPTAASPCDVMRNKKDAAKHNASEEDPHTPSFSASSCVEEEAATKKVILLAPPHCQALYRRLGATFLKDRATALDKVFLPDGTWIGSPRKNARREVVQGCKEVAKRLSSREENIRQTFQWK